MGAVCYQKNRLKIYENKIKRKEKRNITLIENKNEETVTSFSDIRQNYIFLNIIGNS